jgi:exopolysaccharide production protein ExoZ
MRFNNIQLLRVFAALGVVVYHLGCHGPALVGIGSHWLKFPLWAGFPVPLFFAVSGFVLAHAVQSATPGRFLLARFLRLYPGFWLAVLGTLLFMRFRVYTEHHRWLVHFVEFGSTSLWPRGADHPRYFLGIEWSLVYEVFLSIAIAAISLFGPRRAVPILSAIWLAGLAIKMVVWPGLHHDQFPHWTTIAFSPYNVPFLLGVIAYSLKSADRRWGVLVAPAFLGLLALVSFEPMTPEQAWTGWGLAGAGLVWLAVRLPQLGDRNRLVRLGDCTYGLFLFHVPLMFAVLYPASRLGWYGRAEALWAAGFVAIVGGLLFGRLESAIHSRLRPIAKWPRPRLPELSIARFIRLFARAWK